MARPFTDWSEEVRELSTPFGVPTTEHVVLGLHEAADKLWTAGIRGNRKELGKRLASALIGVIEAANHFGIANLDARVDDRLHELRTRLTH